MVDGKKVLATTIAVLCLAGVAVGGAVYAKETNLKDRIWLNQHVSIEQASSGDGEVQEINNAKAVSFWNLDYQQTVTNKINKEVKNGNYTIENPLLIINPYGTNTCSVNVYFEAEEGATLEYEVSTDDYGTFKATAYTGEEKGLYQAQMLGFMPEEENTVTLTLKKDGETIGTSTHTVKMLSAASKGPKKPAK